MPFSANVKENVLVACKRCCSLCHKFCGPKIEVHHIKQEADGGANTFDNAIALCFDCHADMTSYDFNHPKGNKYSESELCRHRDGWYEIAKTMQEPQIPSPNDIAVYNKLLELLPINGGVYFVAHNNFDGFSFSKKRIEDLFDFDYYCMHNPVFEFFDTELDEKRELLVQKIDLLTTLFVKETVSNGNDRCAVPSEWEEAQPERYLRAVSEIHSLGQEVWRIYSKILQLAVRKLNVPPPL